MQDEANSPKADLPNPQRGRQRAQPSRRSLARFAAVQALYQMDVTGIAARQVVREFLEHRLRPEGSSVPAEPEGLQDGDPAGEVDREFFRDLVFGVETHRPEIDHWVERFLDRDWSLERLDHLMRAILRAGAFELIVRLDIPPAVAISEYLRLSDAFVGDKGAAFTNKVLDQISRERAQRPGRNETPLQT